MPHWKDFSRFVVVPWNPSSLSPVSSVRIGHRLWGRPIDTNIFTGPLVHCPPTLLSPSTELRNVKLSLRFFNDYLDVLTILLSITSTKIDSVTLFAWECPFPDDLENFSLRWFKIEDALCRLWELKKGSESGGGVMVDVYFDGAELADEVSRLSRRGEFMPRFQEGGILNIGMCDYNRAMAGIVPKEFR